MKLPGNTSRSCNLGLQTTNLNEHVTTISSKRFANSYEVKKTCDPSPGTLFSIKMPHVASMRRHEDWKICTLTKS